MSKKLTNTEVLKLAQKLSPTFASQTSQWTAETFTQKGYEALKLNESEAINDYFGLSMKAILNRIEAGDAVDTLEAQGFGEHFTEAYGEMLQRIQINEIKPINPQYRKLQNFGSVDPFVIRKPKAEERFFKQNFDYQNLITIQEMEAQKIFTSETGMFDFIAGIMTALNTAYVVQSYEAKKEAINAGINSTKYPLQESQIVKLTLDDEPTDQQMIGFLLTLANIKSDMIVRPTTKAYNSMKYQRRVNPSSLCLLVRPELMNRLKYVTSPYAFNNGVLNFESLGFKVVEVDNFGGIYYVQKGTTDKLLPVYDQLGTCIGYNTTGTGDPLDESQIETVDPNEKVQALLVDKGYLFTSEQQPYMLKSIDNPAGLYRNYWASRPNGTIVVDYAYTCVKFEKE